MATNLGKHRLTRHRSALPANSTSSCPRSRSLGNATLVAAERSGWRRVLGASKARPSAKGAHPYRKWACLEALSLATNKSSQRGTGYPFWGHPTKIRFSRGSTGYKTNDNIRRELRITGILDKIDEYKLNWLSHLQRIPQNWILWNHTTTDHQEVEQLEDRRSVGASSCSSGEGTDQRVQSLMFMMMTNNEQIQQLYVHACSTFYVLEPERNRLRQI